MLISRCTHMYMRQVVFLFPSRYVSIKCDELATSSRLCLIYIYRDIKRYVYLDPSFDIYVYEASYVSMSLCLYVSMSLSNANAMS